MFILIFVLFFILIGIISIILLLKNLNKIVIYKNKSKYLINNCSKTSHIINFFKNKSRDIYISELTNLNPPFLFYTSEEWSLENNNNYYTVNNKSNYYYIICKGYYYYFSDLFCINDLIINNDIIITIFDLKKYYNKVKIIE